jgi:hypothetical protein
VVAEADGDGEASGAVRHDASDASDASDRRAVKHAVSRRTSREEELSRAPSRARARAKGNIDGIRGERAQCEDAKGSPL